MAAPNKERSVTSDKYGNPLLSTRQINVADPAAISTGVLTVTYTAGAAPTANGALTVANSATPTVVELLEYCAELQALVVTLKADVTAVRTQLTLALDTLEAHGLMVPS